MNSCNNLRKGLLGAADVSEAPPGMLAVLGSFGLLVVPAEVGVLAPEAMRDE